MQLKFNNSIFQTKYMRYEKNVEIDNYLTEWGLQILIWTFCDRIYILWFGLKKTIMKIKNSIFQAKYEIQNKR